MFEDRKEFLISDSTGKYPELSLIKFCKLHRIEAPLDSEVIINALEMAYLTVIKSLNNFLCRNNFENLLAVSDRKIGDKKEIELLFEKAVFCEAKSVIFCEYLTIDSRKDAQENYSKSQKLQDYYHELSTTAINQILSIDDAGSILIDTI